jgi:hypothetical protein
MFVSFGGSGTFSNNFKIIKILKGKDTNDDIEYSIAEDKDFKRYNVKKIKFKDSNAADDCCFEVYICFENTEFELSLQE